MGSIFSLRRDGTIDARLTGIEADVITRVAEQVAGAIADGEAPTKRLFPPAYPDNPEQDEEFRAMTRGDLSSFKKEAVKTVIRSIGSGHRKRNGDWRGTLDEDTSRAWLSVLNDARLVMGTSLDVTDEDAGVPLPEDDPRAAAFNLYLYLGGVEEMLIDVLAARDLDDASNEEEQWD